MDHLKASVIISVYSNVAALEVVLNSLRNQTERNFEIIISEDAEHESMKDFVANYNFSNPYKHITQQDIGWRKNMALNNAIRIAASDWLIFIDGDCVLHPRFVEFHTAMKDEKVVLAGKRVKLNQFHSEKLIQNLDYIKSLQKILIKQVFGAKRNGCKFVEEGIFINPKSLFGFIPKMRSMYQLKGCNMSFPKDAALAINGFDEDYTKPAIGEDIDLGWRFAAAGYKMVSVRNLAVQYHLYHKENWTDQEENIAIMNKKMAANEYVCKNGLNKK